MRVFLFLLTLPFFTILNLNEIRSKYEVASLSEDNLNDFLALLNKSSVSPALKTAYLGAAKAISARFYFNPVNKLSAFNEGKNKIENSVKSEPKNIEIRYIRFSIQSNVPSLLGYSLNLEEDKKLLINFILQKENETIDADLYRRIKAYLKVSPHVSQTDKAKL